MGGIGLIRLRIGRENKIFMKEIILTLYFLNNLTCDFETKSGWQILVLYCFYFYNLNNNKKRFARKSIIIYHDCLFTISFNVPGFFLHFL